MAQHEEYLKSVTDRLVRQIEENKAPWQRPFDAGDYSNTDIPVNINGKPYNGMNMINLMSIADEKGYTDNRWLTFNGARDLGGKVKKGEKASDIYYWKFTDTITTTKKDKDGNDILDEKGKPQKIQIEVKLERPQVFFAKVFNAEQIEGLPPREITVKKLEDWERHEAAERILKASNVPIIHKVGERAYYSPSNDHIVLPERTQFKTNDAYYATALHELGHATGHESRLNRDLSGAFGSESYAKEELRAEIASMLIGQELQIGHDPSQHIAYLQSWAKVVKNEPKEIFKAVKDADAIHQFVLSLDPQRTKSIDDKSQNQSVIKLMEQDHNEIKAINKDLTTPLETYNNIKQFIDSFKSVNYSVVASKTDGAYLLNYFENGRKTEISTEFGGMDGKALTSFKGERIEHSYYTSDHLQQQDNLISALTKDIEEQKQLVHDSKEAIKHPQADNLKIYINVPFSEKDEVKALGAKWDKENSLWYAPAGEDQSKFAKWVDRPDIPSPEQAFADYLKGQKIIVEAGHPKMDGKAHRLSNEDSKSKNVLYQLYPNDGGVPSGRVTNFSREGVPEKWVYPMEYIQRQQNIDAVDRAKHGENYVKQEKVAVEVTPQQNNIQKVDLDQNRLDTYNKTAERVQKLFEISPVAQQHDYLDRKGVGANEVARIVPDASKLPNQLKDEIVIVNDWRQAKSAREQNPDKMVVQKGSLIIPQYSSNGELRSFETIGYNGAKYALKDGEKNGLSLQLGKIENGKPFILAEGYATGATFKEQAKIPTVIAFGKGNLDEIAKELRANYPDSRIYFAADNDHRNEKEGKGNAGIENATKAADLVGGYVLVPKFNDGDTGKDWNDIFIDKGLNEFKNQLKQQLEKIQVSDLGKDQKVDNLVQLDLSKLKVTDQQPVKDFINAIHEKYKDDPIKLNQALEQINAKIPEIAQGNFSLSDTTNISRQENKELSR